MPLKSINNWKQAFYIIISCNYKARHYNLIKYASCMCYIFTFSIKVVVVGNRIGGQSSKSEGAEEYTPTASLQRGKTPQIV